MRDRFSSDDSTLTSQDVLFIGDCPNEWGGLLLHADIFLGKLDSVV